VGGAIYGNAGAYGQSISDSLLWVEIFNGDKIIRISKDECRFGYRDSIFKHKNWVILEAKFELKFGDKKTIQNRREEIKKIRARKYKTGVKCPGSYFKNIIASELPGDVLRNIDQNKIIYGKIPAGYLLESVGACGMKVGGIRVADNHGNLFINDGQGTFSDINSITHILKEKVKEKYGIELEEEVVILQ
jgi:UDP-N-acetylmuramate dehydrogenase